MGYQLLTTDLDKVLLSLSEEYDVYAPKLFEGDGCFSDIDVVRYGKINFLNEIVFDQKSDYSFKEILTPISETLFYFTEDEAIVPKERKKGAVVFLRACDLNALKRLDDIYLHNGAEDFYYKRLRENTKFILMECKESFETCFCVSMGTNKADNYDAYISVKYGKAYIDCKWDKLTDLIKKEKNEQTDVQLLLNTGRGTVGQWHTQTRTREVQFVEDVVADKAYVYMNTILAEENSIKENDKIRIYSINGKDAVFFVKITENVQYEELYAPIHYIECNMLTPSIYDPYSKEPSYKATPVRFEKLEVEADV